MKKLSFLLVFIFGLVIIVSAQTVTIGWQEWSTKNLNVTNFRNGDPIQQVKTLDEWIKATGNDQPAWCYYDFNPDNGPKYGKLYNFYAVIDPRGLAPKGWRIPNTYDWLALRDYLGKDQAGFKMKTIGAWANNGNGNNISGFSGLPGGVINFGGFQYIGEWGWWWSSTKHMEDQAYGYGLVYDEVYLLEYTRDLGLGQSVRCIKD